MTAPLPVSDAPPLWALAVRQPGGRPGCPGAAALEAGTGQKTGAPLWREVLPPPVEPRAVPGPEGPA